MIFPGQFWRGTLGEAKEAFSSHQPKGEITVLVEGKAICVVETPSEDQLEKELRGLLSAGHNLSMVTTTLVVFTFQIAVCPNKFLFCRISYRTFFFLFLQKFLVFLVFNFFKPLEEII